MLPARRFVSRADLTRYDFQGSSRFYTRIVRELIERGIPRRGDDRFQSTASSETLLGDRSLREAREP
jgi:hypothetical protein